MFYPLGKKLRKIYVRYLPPTDNARQTNRQQKTNFLEKQGTLSETNYLII